jgi:hypothetical protein
MVQRERLMVIALAKGLDEYSEMSPGIEALPKDDRPACCG